MGDRELRWVEWLDSCHTEGWHDEDGFARPLVVQSVGFIHQDEETYVMLTMTRDENKRWNNSISIPKAVISKQTKLRKA